MSDLSEFLTWLYFSPQVKKLQSTIEQLEKDKRNVNSKIEAMQAQVNLFVCFHANYLRYCSDTLPKFVIR